MGKLQASVVGGLVRASIQVSAPSAGVSHVVPVADLKWIHIITGAVLDPIGFNRFIVEMQVTVDQATYQFGKRVLDSVASTDETTYVLFKKGALEQLQTSEVRSFDMAKDLQDVVDATDDFQGAANLDDEQIMVFSKALPVEQQVALDNAIVGTGKRLTDTFEKTDLLTAEVGKGLTESLGTTEERTNSFEKSLSDSVDAGDEFNAVALTDDGEVMIFGKTLADEFTQSDSVSVQPEKGVEDAVATGDQIDTFEVGKGLEDVPVTSETLGFDTSKALADEANTAELTTFDFGIGILDRVSYGDGPNAYDTYAVGYFAETYALEGFPAVTFNKVLNDTVHSTDDFFGVANTDDDETMQFGKILTDLAHPMDVTTVGYSKAVADLISMADSQTFAVGKSLTDQVSKSDLAIKGTDKVLSDSKTTLDIVVRGIGKDLGDNPVTAEYNSFALSKVIADVVITTDDFLGNANADDDETMLFGKTISDSFTKSDSTVKTAGKGLADAASTSESGSIVWTDYWPIGYTDTTSGVYVGNSRTF